MTMPQAVDSSPSQLLTSVKSRLVVTLILIVASALPRFYDLGRLSFYSDEDYTWISVNSVLNGDGSRMPTGMPYRRALALTWANAGVVALLGEQGETPYRVTAAMFGTLTPAALFLTGSAFVSPPVALVASTMLAVSEWHISFSRFGRMYTPFLFFFILTSYFFWQWGRKGRWSDGFIGIGLFAVTVSLHQLGLIAVQFALLPLILPGSVASAPRIIVITAAAATAVLFGLSKYLIQRPYELWNLPADFPLQGMSVASSAEAWEPVIVLLALLGGALGAWWGWRLVRTSDRRGEWLRSLTILASLTTAGAFAATGHLWGASLTAVVAVITHRGHLRRFIDASGLPLILVTLTASAWCVYALLTMGLGDGLSRIGTFPFPYFAFLWSQFPGLVVIFWASALWLLATGVSNARAGTACMILAVVLPMAAIGMVRAWGGTRYLFQVYPYILLAAAAVVVHFGTRIVATRWPTRAEIGGMILGILLAVSGITGGHGIGRALDVATLNHGEPVNRFTHITPFRPDHRGPGEFVRRSMRSGDVVIAEDPIVQTVYAGRADYWFRRAGDARKFLYLGSDGRPRDIYVNSVLLSTISQLHEVVDSARGMVWFITSGENDWNRSWYLSAEQSAWLDSVEATLDPAFVGMDGTTRVYCLNCEG